MFKGIGLSLLASVTFGILYFYSSLLAPLNSAQTFGWRMISTLPFLTLVICYFGDFKRITEIWQRLRARPSFILLLLLSSFLASVQLWLFLWGPMHQRGLEVSLGYFLLPLCLVLSGSVLYKEKLSKLQKIAVAFALLGVVHEVWQQGQIAWETALVMFGYTAYFLLRKKIQTDHLGGFWWDIVLCLPVALYWVYRDDFSAFILQPSLIVVVLGLGLLSTLGLGSYILSSRYLPLVLFGLLSYVEPVLLALVAMCMGEQIELNEWLTYLPIWFAVLLLVIEGSWHLLKMRKQQRDIKRKAQHYQAQQ